MRALHSKISLVRIVPSDSGSWVAGPETGIKKGFWLRSSVCLTQFLEYTDPQMGLATVDQDPEVNSDSELLIVYVQIVRVLHDL